MDVVERDVLIVGAGLSGIGAACHLKTKCPNKSLMIVEGRERMGGTWDLFRYPGIRSDSDMYTLGYRFRPWDNPKAIADGPSILEYIHTTAREYDVDGLIEYEHRVTSADWDSARRTWVVDITTPEGELQVLAKFLYVCGGYYNYENGYRPKFANEEDFAGEIIHPQHWPEDYDYSGKRVVVIGSGATAITLVPSMAEKAEHVVMLQRSPTYVLTAPGIDPIATWLRENVPNTVAYRLVRTKNVAFSIASYAYCRKYPEHAKEFMVGLMRKQLGEGYDVEKHFTPAYNPWDQRVCLAPDGDFFKSIRSGQASVVTDHIERFTKTGILLRSGEELAADVVVTATGLNVEFLGKIKLKLDGEDVVPSSLITYKGMMLSGIPNLAFAVGYTNASWTLKADLTSDYVCRLLKHMDKRGFDTCQPNLPLGGLGTIPLLDFTSGYVQRALAHMPKQGAVSPWRIYQNYVLDLVTLRFGDLQDSAMDFA